LEGSTAAPTAKPTGESKILTFQAIIALSLIVVFGIVISVSLFRYTSTEVIGIAGIFASWITAIIAFFFVERGARSTVHQVTQSTEERLKAKEVTAGEYMENISTKWEKTVQQQWESFRLFQERTKEQIDKLTAKEEPAGEALGEILE
jgi:ascorbate-specific PTS system EIIC-type component UlaA